MPQLQCPECQKVFRVKDEWAGKRVKCPCGKQLVVPNSDAEANLQASAPSAIKQEPLPSPSVSKPQSLSNDFNAMPVAPSDPFNPYAPSASTMPSALPAEGDEAIRKSHLSHESSIKSIGVLYLLGSIIGFLLTVVYLVMGVAAFVVPSRNPSEGMVAGAFLLGLGIVVGGISTFQFILARGLSRLTPWCRIGGIAFSCVGLLGFPIGTLISAYFLYLLASQKGVFIFSPEYARIIAATPHIKYKTSIIVWILLGILVFVIGLGIVGFIATALVG